MSITRRLGGVLFALALATPAAAQNRDFTPDRTVFFSARGGGFNGLSSLNDAGPTADFKKVGFHVGGGVGVQLHRYVSVRGDFTFARNELRNDQVATGSKLDRYFYDAALQLQYPTASGLEPYLFAGGGGVTLNEVNSSSSSKTKPAGTFGLGFNYRIPNSPFGLFAEGKSWLYKLDGMGGALTGIDKTQFDVAWTGGASYKLPF
jgi:outer membrane protein with beta-barrel domain